MVSFARESFSCNSEHFAAYRVSFALHSVLSYAYYLYDIFIIYFIILLILFIYYFIQYLLYYIQCLFPRNLMSRNSMHAMCKNIKHVQRRIFVLTFSRRNKFPCECIGTKYAKLTGNRIFERKKIDFDNTLWYNYISDNLPENYTEFVASKALTAN